MNIVLNELLILYRNDSKSNNPGNHHRSHSSQCLCYMAVLLFYTFLGETIPSILLVHFKFMLFRQFSILNCAYYLQFFISDITIRV